MIITTTAPAVISAILMPSAAEPPSFSEPTHHPVIKATLKAILTQLFVFSMIEGIILIQNYNLSVVYFS